ncbi:MAG: ABC transporter permease [Sodalis sp. (in: enterobacteria)]|uniref:ABC transporter permease n=1 Tax=Sodalis sp. (in: enterobacteria) TaxID=1898979 RepID=UPI0039E258EC
MMRQRRPPSDPARGGRVGLTVILGWPCLMLGIFMLVPFMLLIRVSLAPADVEQLWGQGVTLAAFGAMQQYGVMSAIGYSLVYALAIAALALCLAFPLTWFITGMTRRGQIGGLIFLLSTLALSDVLIAFSWQVMLARRQWIAQWLLATGLLGRSKSLVPGTGAVLYCLLYISLPFTVLLLYPALSRLDRSYLEAARPLGATPVRSFFTLVIPLARMPIMMAFARSSITTLGAYTGPLVLGRPENWPLSVIIGKVALSAQNMPLSAARALTLLLALTLVLIARRGRRVG